VLVMLTANELQIPSASIKNRRTNAAEWNPCKGN
jgi:hypothetical protein